MAARKPVETTIAAEVEAVLADAPEMTANRPLRALARRLAAQLDDPDTPASSLPGLSRELRAALDGLGREARPDMWGALGAELGGPA